MTVNDANKAKEVAPTNKNQLSFITELKSDENAK